MSDYLESLFSLAGKTALVTGGAKGIGRMISEGLLQAGARVYIASRSADDCAAAAEEMSALGDCRAFPHDLSGLAGVQALVADVEQAGHGLDILINNSGATWGASLEAFPESGWDKVMDLNVKSPFFLLQNLLPLLKAAASSEDPARVINISSVAGMLAATQSAYSYMASKAAISHLSKGLALDLAKDNIAVNAVAPGFFPSKMTRHMSSEEGMEMLCALTPLGRIGKPSDVSGMVIYLCSPAGAFVTGSVLPLSGGVELGGSI